MEAKFLMIHAMQLSGYIATPYVRLLYEYLEARGIDALALLGEPPPADGERYPLQDWARLLNRADAQLQVPALGLQIGCRITPAHIGVLGYVILACENLGEALTRLQRYIRLVYDHGPMHSRVEGGSVILEWGQDCSQPGQLVDDVAIAALVQFARNIAGDSWQLESVSFLNPPPAEIAPYRRFFACEVNFAAPVTAVRIPVECLQLPLRQPDQALLGILEQQAERMLAELPQEDFPQQLRRVIMRLCRESEPVLEAAAFQLNVSARTLQRRLQAYGLSFQQVLDETRYLLARHYLADSRLQLAEIAQLLGYSEQSAFNHAFRRWAGCSPRQSRARQAVTEG